MTTYAAPNVTGLVGMWGYANYASSGWFSPLFLMSIFIISFVYLKIRYYRIGDCVTLSGFITFIFGALLWAAALVQSSWVILYLIIAVIGSLIMWLES